MTTRSSASGRAFSRRAQAWMWQTLLNGLTFRANFARDLRAGRLHPQRHRASGCASGSTWSSRSSARPLVALVSVPLELGATLAGRGGELHATAHDLG